MTNASSALTAVERRKRSVVLLTRDNVAPHAGGKAPADIRDICERMGFTCLSLPVVPTQRYNWINVKRFTLGPLRLLAQVVLSRAPDVVIIQHPIVGKLEKRLILRMFRSSRKVALIHDLDVLRKPTNHTFDDLWFLGQCDVLIAHNEAMRRFLVEELPVPQVLVIGAFDFLIPSTAPAVPPPGPSPSRMFVIGNLDPMKAAYLYEARSLDRPIAAFGPNCVVDRLPAGVEWRGIVSGGRLPVESIDGFGLVWDGDSPDGLAGQWGEYLKYNAPHKLSLYIVLGLPVIVPRASAMADFVRAEGIGFEADSVADAARLISSVTAEEWGAYCQAVLRLREKIVSGFYTKRVMERALRLLGDPG